MRIGTDSYNLFFYAMAGVSALATLMSASLRPLSLAASSGDIADKVTWPSASNSEHQSNNNNDTLLAVAHPVDNGNIASQSALEAALLSSSSPRS
jgi:hypothetical protein